MIALFGLITLLTILVHYLYRRFARMLELAKHIPGPPTVPLLGNSLLFIGKDPVLYIPIMQELTDKYGKTLKLWLGPELVLFMRDVKDVEHILGDSKLIDKSDQYELLHPWLREGLLLSFGWFCNFRLERINVFVFLKERNGFNVEKLLRQPFISILEQFITSFHKQSSILVEILSKRSGEETEIYHFITLCALDVICGNYIINTIVVKISMVLHKRMFDILYRFNFLFRLTPLARQQDKALEVLHNFSRKVITSRREELLKANEKESSIEENHNDVGTKRKMAFLDILLQSEIDGKPLSDSDIQEEVDTFMFEGHDTTTSAITFCLYNLSMNSRAQQKCFEEILSIFGNDKTKSASYNDLCNLHYMELCIKETLRMFPSVPLIGRKIKEECTINGKIIPAGTNIAISPLAMGHDENIFPNPEQFIPERFDVETSAEKLNPYAFIPFSAGPRNCIGQKFAMLEAKSVISKILRYFELEHVESGEPQFIAELILKTKNAVKFRLKPRIY